MTVWEQQVNLFETGKSYEFRKLMVRIYNNLTTLSYPKERASFTQIEELDNVVDQYDEHDLESVLDYVNIEIGGVASLSSITHVLNAHRKSTCRANMPSVQMGHVRCSSQ